MGLMKEQMQELIKRMAVAENFAVDNPFSPGDRVMWQGTPATVIARMFFAADAPTAVNNTQIACKYGVREVPHETLRLGWTE